MQLMILGLHDFTPEDCLCSCTFLEAPYEAGKIDSTLDTAGRSWYVAGRPIEKSLRSVIDHCAEAGPYDGAYGFSQGTSILALLSDSEVWRTSGGSEDAFPPWRFVINGCGTEMPRSGQS